MKLCISREALKRKIMEDEYDGSVEAGGFPSLVYGRLAGQFYENIGGDTGRTDTVEAQGSADTRQAVEATVFVTEEARLAIEARADPKLVQHSDAPDKHRTT